MTGSSAPLAVAPLAATLVAATLTYAGPGSAAEAPSVSGITFHGSIRCRPREPSLTYMPCEVHVLSGVASTRTAPGDPGDAGGYLQYCALGPDEEMVSIQLHCGEDFFSDMLARARQVARDPQHPIGIALHVSADFADWDPRDEGHQRLWIHGVEVEGPQAPGAAPRALN